FLLTRLARDFHPMDVEHAWRTKERPSDNCPTTPPSATPWSPPARQAGSRMFSTLLPDLHPALEYLVAGAKHHRVRAARKVPSDYLQLSAAVTTDCLAANYRSLRIDDLHDSLRSTRKNPGDHATAGDHVRRYRQVKRRA